MLWPRRGLKEDCKPTNSVVVEATNVWVAYEGQTPTLPAVVVKGKGSHFCKI